MSSIIKTN